MYDITGKREYLKRPLQKWQQAVEGGYVCPLGGVGEKFQMNFSRDEGCSEADWLRLNLTLWRLTGEMRFLDMAERLLWNHYAMNRTANGGYGHHDFICDAVGPQQMQANFTEAVWCCTFHGLLGLQTLKSYVVAGSSRGLFINFPLDCTAAVSTQGRTWHVTVSCEDRAPCALTCRVRLDATEPTLEVPAVWLRRPVWAQGVAITDAAGRACPWEDADRDGGERGYLRLPVRSGDAGSVNVTFSWTPHVENRRLQKLTVRPDVLGRHAGVVVCDGPRILLANTQQPQPVIVAIIDKQGQLTLPRTSDGSCRLIQLERLDADAQAIATAAENDTRCQLADWAHLRQDAAAAFVFDLMCPFGKAARLRGGG
ncbi:MAG: glycoside hydrolase family protein [Pirellulaceae bacterium]